MFKEYYSILNSVHLMALNTGRIGYLIKKYIHRIKDNNTTVYMHGSVRK